MVNRSKSPSTERVPLDLFSSAVPDDDVLAVPSSGAQEQRAGSSANGGGVAQSHVCITAIADSDVRFHIQRRCQFTCAVFGDEILDWDSFDGLSSAMVLPPVGVNKKQFVGMSNLGKAQTKPTFRKSPSGFSFPLQVLSIGILRLRPRSPGATIQSAKFRSRIFNDVAAMSQKIFFDRE